MNQPAPGGAGPVLPGVIDWGEFSGLVRATFFTVKRALAQQRADVARHVMTEAAWERLRAQVDVLRHDECVNRQTGIDLTEIEPGQHDVDGPLDRVDARLMVTGVDCVVESASGRVVSGSAERSDWRETWTFERSRDPVLLEQARAPKCPTCGAPRAIDADGLCSFCHAVVPGAKTDWLLAEISIPSMAAVDPSMDRRANRDASTLVMNAMQAQAAEHPWVGSDPAAPALAGATAAGIDQIQAHDPGFNAAEVVVEARDVFLKLEDSRNQLHPREIRPVVGDVLFARELDRARQVTAAGRNEVRAYLDINAVTIVDAGSSGGWDRLVVRVDAVSARSVVDVASGDLLESTATTHPWREEMLFERRSTAVTNPLTGLLAHRCPECGSPAEVSDEGLCVACGKHVTGGEKDWILVNVQVAGDAAAGTAP